MTRAETKAVEILHAMEAKGGPMSQSQQILAHLFANGAITPLDALRQYGCFRLGARIWDLRHLGVPIRSELVTDGDTRYAKYSLEEDDYAGL